MTHTNVRCCPACGSERVGVINARVYSHIFHRRRKCQLCGARFSTVEIPEDWFDELLDERGRHLQLRMTLRAAMGDKIDAADN